MDNNDNFIKLLKKNTTIDKKFIDIFFKNFRMAYDLEFHIDIEDIAKYLKTSVQTIKDRLKNVYAQNINYMEKVDYIKIRQGKEIKYYVTYTCFENLAMQGTSSKSVEVRAYFIELRLFIMENKDLLYQTIENKKKMLKNFSSFESIYFFAVDKKETKFKIGRTKNIIQRLNTYNTGRIYEVDIKYYAVVKNMKRIENCVKEHIKSKRLVKRKEIYEISKEELKSIIHNCYKCNVSKEEHAELIRNLGALCDLYFFCKDHTKLQPCVIIGSEIYDN